MQGIRNVAQRGFKHASSAIQTLDRGLGTAARLYHTMAPIVAPLASEVLGNQRAAATHKAITEAMTGYGNVRTKVIEAHRMGDALARVVKKEIPSIM